MNNLVIRNDYRPLHDCITIQELRWILQDAGRYTKYYAFYLIRCTAGLRTAEMIENVTTYHLLPKSGPLLGFRYCIKKPARNKNRHGETVEVNKHRDVILEPFVREEVIIYLNQHMKIINNEYVSPYDYQRILPFKDTQITSAQWWKMKARMNAAGFDTDRKVRDWIRDNGQRQEIPVYVLRPHILRHFACSVFYYKCGKDIVRTQQWIGHNDIETTKQYIHTPEAMGTTEEYLVKSSWKEILGFETTQQSIGRYALAPSQTALNMY